MGLCWVTGISGSGKSTLVRHLIEQGHPAWDADLGFCQWRHLTTGALAPDVVARPDGWLEGYGWFLDIEMVRELAARSGDELCVLAGAVANEHEAWSLFEHVVCLVSDDDTIRARLAARGREEFGHTADELAHVLSWNATMEDRYREFGATIVDARLPTSEVAAAILLAASPR